MSQKKARPGEFYSKRAGNYLGKDYIRGRPTDDKPSLFGKLFKKKKVKRRVL